MRFSKLTYVIVFAAMLAAGYVGARENSADLYQQGMEAFKAGNYGSADLIFRKIVDADDDYRDRAWYHLGLSIFRQKKYESAIFEFNRFLLECTTSNLCSQSRFWIAESEYHRKKYIKSIEEYNRFIAQSPDAKLTVDAMLRIGEIYHIQNRYDEAVLVWKKTLDKMEDEPKKQKLNLKIGEALFYDERYDESAAVLEQLQSLRPDAKIAARSSLTMGRIYQLKKNHRGALRQFGAIPERMLKEKPYYDAQYFKALSYLELGQQYIAKSNLELFLIIGMDSDWYFDAKYDLGRVLINENREQRGVRLLEEARLGTTKMELRSKAAMSLAKIYLKKNPKDAIPFLEDSVSLTDPEEQKNALLLLSRVYIEADRNDDAERLLDLLANKYPYDSSMEEVQFLLSRVYLSRGDIDRADQKFKKIREINPFSKFLNDTHFYLGMARYREGKPVKAVEHLNRYLETKNPELHFEANEKLHEIYLEMGEYNNAMKTMGSIMRRYRGRNGIEDTVYKSALAYREKNLKYDKLFDFIVEQKPRSAAAGAVLLTRGDEAFQKKDYSSSERYYRQFLAVPGRENAPSVYLYRVISLYRLGRFREAVRMVEDERMPPGDEFTEKLVRFWEGKSLSKLGKHGESYRILKNFDLMFFSDEDLSMMVDISLLAKDVEGARRAFGRLMRNPVMYADAMFRLGMFFKENNDLQQAKELFSELAQRFPDAEKVPDARLELADIKIREGDYNGARSELDSVTDAVHGDRKNALLSVAYFKGGNPDLGVKATEKNMESLKKSPFGEMAFQESMVHYYKKGDREGFKKYSELLKKYPGNGNLVGYYTGKLELDSGSYGNAYYSFYKLSSFNNEYRQEALFHLGIISLYKQENREKAMFYFTRLSKDAGGENIFAQKSKLLLSVDAYARGDRDAAKSYLTGIIGSATSRETLDRAMNLFEEYGFYGETSGKEKKGAK